MALAARAGTGRSSAGPDARLAVARRIARVRHHRMLPRRPRRHRRPHPGRDGVRRPRRDGLWVDAGGAGGVRSPHRRCVVVGLETVGGPDVVAALAERLGERMAFSLDLRDGRPMGDVTSWPAADGLAIAVEAVRRGVRRLIVLDLARVGVGTGTGTEALCADLSAPFPHLHVTAGGGVRSRADLVRLRDAGVAAVLVASALHDGGLSRADLADL
ncbi:MAG: HisA/HisF-related TIM barrel protein [Gemmataceae bacterium]